MHATILDTFKKINKVSTSDNLSLLTLLKEDKYIQFVGVRSEHYNCTNDY